MNFQQRYLKLSNEIKNIKDAQSKVVLNLRSVVYSTSQTMQYDHYWGTYSSVTITFCNEDGSEMTGDDVDFMFQVYATCSNSGVYLNIFERIYTISIAGRHPYSWATVTWTADIQIITSKKVPKIKVVNSYTGQTTYITQGTII